MSEAQTPPPKIFRVIRWFMTIAVPLCILVVILLVTGVISDATTTPLQAWGDLLLVVILQLLVIRAWVRPNQWLSTTYLGIIGTGLSRFVMAVLQIFEMGPGPTPIFWLLAGCALVFTGWVGLQAVRRGANPFASPARRSKSQ